MFRKRAQVRFSRLRANTADQHKYGKADDFT